MRHDFNATLESVGDWQGQESEAVQCWNKFVSPALTTKLNYDPTTDNDDDVELLSQIAWDKFCDTTDDESFDDLGKRVADFVRSY